MDSPTPFTSMLKGLDAHRRHADGFYETNASVTSYEDIPDEQRVNRNSAAHAMTETNRGAVMNALQNLQQKIQRLELERSGAESDMQHLASETARFRKLLNKKEEKPSQRADSEPCMDSFHDAERRCNGNDNTKIFPKLESPSPVTANFPSLAYGSPYSSTNNPEISMTPSKAHEMALASAETRCTILEKQLAYMRTLLETAERDRNEAQRRSRARGEQLTVWRQKAESHVRGLEEELHSERRRNRHHADLNSQAEVRCRRNDVERTKVDNHVLPEISVEEDEDIWIPSKREHCHSSSSQNGGLFVTSTPRTKVKDAAVVKQQKSVNPRRPPRQEKTSNVPFVVGRSVGQSHNVNVNLQSVLGILSKRGTSTEKALPTKRQRQTRNAQVDKQMREDVGVVLEELVDEFDDLCREHQSLVRQLADATSSAEKSSLEQRLTDIVNKMEVKGQQIGRLRSYMANFGANSVPENSGNPKVEIRTTIEAQPSPDISPPVTSVTRRTSATERRERSLNLLKNAKQFQACSLDPKDISWH